MIGQGGVENWVKFWSLIAISANSCDLGEVEQASMTLIEFVLYGTCFQYSACIKHIFVGFSFLCSCGSL
jgi:hypothetical protein